MYLYQYKYIVQYTLYSYLVLSSSQAQPLPVSKQSVNQTTKIMAHLLFLCVHTCIELGNVKNFKKR